MKRILLIEDNPNMRDNIKDILELANYKVETAANGKEGIEKIHTKRPDLILCDIMMPELDGYGVLHILNSTEDTADIPFIFITAKTTLDDFRKGMNFGADDYLTKPFSGKELLNSIEMRLRKNQLVRTTFRSDIEEITDFLNELRQLKGYENLRVNRHMRMHKRKDFLYLEGDPVKDLYFIHKGKVKTFKTNEEGKELVTSLHHEGEFIGYTSLLQETHYTESAVALEDTEVYIISKSDFLALINTNREVAHQFIKLLSRNLAEAEERLIDIAYRSVRRRISGTLMKLHQTMKPTESHIELSRKDIANMVGTATETLNRTLADFIDEGIIATDAKGIIILDTQKMQKVAGLQRFYA